MSEKVIRDGKVAVLISPGYGAGWSTWMDSLRDEALFCPALVEAVEREASLKELEEIAARLFPDAYLGGLRGLVVEWLPLGTHFVIDEFDGAESIRVRDNVDWYTT